MSEARKKSAAASAQKKEKTSEPADKKEAKCVHTLSKKKKNAKRKRQQEEYCEKEIPSGQVLFLAAEVFALSLRSLSLSPLNLFLYTAYYSSGQQIGEGRKIQSQNSWRLKALQKSLADKKISHASRRFPERLNQLWKLQKIAKYFFPADRKLTWSVQNAPSDNSDASKLFDRSRNVNEGCDRVSDGHKQRVQLRHHV